MKIFLSDAYKCGSAKEMRKWAYEIHSCFLVPGAVLELPNLEDGVVRIGTGIDKFLSEENPDQLREESLLKLFWKARSRARDVLKGGLRSLLVLDLKSSQFTIFQSNWMTSVPSELPGWATYSALRTPN